MWGKSSGFFVRAKREYRKLLRSKKRNFMYELEKCRLNNPRAFYRRMKSKSSACPIGQDMFAHYSNLLDPQHRALCVELVEQCNANGNVFDIEHVDKAIA